MRTKIIFFKSSIVLLLVVFLLLMVEGMHENTLKRKRHVKSVEKEKETEVFPLENLPPDMMKYHLFHFLNGKELIKLLLVDEYFYKKKELQKLLAYGEMLQFLLNWRYEDLIVRLPQMEQASKEYPDQEAISILQTLKRLTEAGLKGSNFERAFFIGNVVWLTYKPATKSLLDDLPSNIRDRYRAKHIGGTNIAFKSDSDVHFVRNGHQCAHARMLRNKLTNGFIINCATDDETFLPNRTYWRKTNFIADCELLELVVENNEIFVMFRKIGETDDKKKKVLELIEKGI